MKPIKDLDPVLIGHLDHFIDQGKWPVKVAKFEANLIKKHLPFLTVTRLPKTETKYFLFTGKNEKIENPRIYQVTVGKKGIPVDVLAAYWEFRYKEENERYDRLYNEVKNITENY